jgi:hypothetical protein
VPSFGTGNILQETWEVQEAIKPPSIKLILYICVHKEKTG